MKKTEENKRSINLFYLSAVLFYLASIITFIVGNGNSMGIVWMCLGSAFLCFGSVNSIKFKKIKKAKIRNNKFQVTREINFYSQS